MFDKAIIDTDRFMDLSMSGKALYFLLGMEADDEGFVSYKKVMRIHGGNEDDIKILVAKNFVLMFESGVVVITDWNKNNYLDKNRSKKTEYQKEKKMLLLTKEDKYEFNNGLTSIEESSIEESRGEGVSFPKKLKRQEIKENVLVVWNEQKIITHKELSKDADKEIEKLFDNCSSAECADELLSRLKDSIVVFGKVYHGEEYWWSHKCNLYEFLKRGFKQFDGKKPEDYLKGRKEISQRVVDKV